jgi:hypothetical protein
MPAKTYAIGIWFDSLYTVKFQKKAGKLALVSHDFPKAFKVAECIDCDGIHLLGAEEGKDLNLRITNYAETSNRHFFLSFRTPEDKIVFESHYTISRWNKADYVLELPFNGE